MANKKRIATSVAAVATAAALLLGGTFAWQSVNQTALNEASDVINPGGRLHDDFNGTNKDVYVENFADEEIFARVRLEEYFEIVMNKGTPAETVEVIVGERVEQKDEEGNVVTDENGTVYDKNGAIFTDYTSDGEFGAANVKNDEGEITYSWWNWTTGGQTQYLPTFNLNKDSLQADINGTYDNVDADGNRYADYVDYLNDYVGDQLVEGDEIYDYDADDIDEGEDAVEGEDIKTVSEDEDGNPITHAITATANASLMSMDEWQALPEAEQIGDYWVYDDDGWVYYAKPIAPHTATGLLLDGIELNQVMDDSWYYAINVVGQFITADDMGKSDGTGFYDETKGEAPSPEALVLLETIGVDTTGPVMVSNAEELKNALANGEDVVIDGEIEASEPPVTEVYPTIDSYFLMHEGGTLSGGTITTTEWTDSTLFVNNEENWPVYGDGANAATVNGTTINAVTSWGMRVQALDAPVTLNGVTISGKYGGLIAEYSQSTSATGGENVIALNDMTITAGSKYPHEGYEWINTAVAAAMGANVVIDGGTYTGNNAVLILSSGAEVTINGGTFEGAIGFASDISEAKKEESSLVIKGGTFTVDPTEFVAEGYEAIYDNETTTWTVQESAVEQKKFNVYVGYQNFGVESEMLSYTGSTLIIPTSKINAWLPISLIGAEKADYSVEIVKNFEDDYFGVERLNGPYVEDEWGNWSYQEWVEEGPCEFINIYATTPGEVLIKAVDDEGNTHELRVIYTEAVLHVDDLNTSIFEHVYAGATHTLWFDRATSYELTSTGHEAGTYINGSTLYVDENETEELTIKITTPDGEYEANPLTVRSTNETKWMIVNRGNTEVDPENTYETLWGSDDLSVFYEGEKAYVRLNESDEYAEQVTSPEQSIWNDVYFDLYANTKQDGTGESAQWHLQIYMAY